MLKHGFNAAAQVITASSNFVGLDCTYGYAFFQMDRNNGAPPPPLLPSTPMLLFILIKLQVSVCTYNQNKSATLESQQHGLVGASHSSVLADGSANMLGVGPMTVFGGGSGCDGSGVSLCRMKRKTLITEAELRLQIFKKQKDAYVKLNGKCDGTNDGLIIGKSAKLPRLKKDLEDSFVGLVRDTYDIKYHEQKIENDLAWRNCVQAFGKTRNKCMELSIHDSYIQFQYAFFGDLIASIPTNHHIYNLNESTTLEGQQHGYSQGAGPSHALVGASHSIIMHANGNANMLVFGGEGMMIPATPAGASPSIMKRKLTEAELRPQISKKQKDPSVEHNGQSLFMHVTRTSDGTNDILIIGKSAKLPHLKKDLEDSFTGLVRATYTIKYDGEEIKNNDAWRNCVQAFGKTGNKYMELSIHE
nr:hypothetical protein [Tanacetum cinerariifolium]